MSYSGTGAAPARERINEFVYQDKGSGATVADPGTPYETSEQETSTVDNVPRISEQEISRLMAEARAEGIRDGQTQAHKQFDEEIAEQGRRVHQALATFQEERQEYYKKVEVQLVHLALAIAAKILHRESQVDRLVVAGLVKVMLERMQRGTTATVHIRPEEASNWKNYFNTNADLAIVEDASLKPGECRLETELGTAEMGLDAQLKEVENGFFDLLAQRPEAK